MGVQPTFWVGAMRQHHTDPMSEVSTFTINFQAEPGPGQRITIV